MATLPPHILLIPGLWEGTRVFDSLIQVLRSHSYTAEAIPLPSTGCRSPGNPSMRDDVTYIRGRIQETVDKAREQRGEVLLFLHSAGAFLGSMAIEELSVGERMAKGEKGGVGKIVFLAGAVWPEGFQHGPLPFFEYNGDEMYCVTPEKLLFNDLAAEEASKWANSLSCHPSSGWDDVVDYGGWKKIPSVYLVAENDALLDIGMQLQMAEMAGSEVERCSAGHCCMIGQPERCAEVVRKAAGEVF